MTQFYFNFETQIDRCPMCCWIQAFKTRTQAGKVVVSVTCRVLNQDWLQYSTKKKKKKTVLTLQ